MQQLQQSQSSGCHPLDIYLHYVHVLTLSLCFLPQLPDSVASNDQLEEDEEVDEMEESVQPVDKPIVKKSGSKGRKTPRLEAELMDFLKERRLATVSPKEVTTYNNHYVIYDRTYKLGCD